MKLRTPHEIALEAQRVCEHEQKQQRNSHAQVACKMYDHVKTAIEARDAEWHQALAVGWTKPQQPIPTTHMLGGTDR